MQRYIIGTKGNSKSAWRLTAFGTNTTHMVFFHIKYIFLLPNWLDVQFRQQRTLEKHQTAHSWV